jgi:hypothetical protein
MDKKALWNDLKNTLGLLVEGNGGWERPDEFRMAGVELVLELMLRAEEKS